MNRNTNSNGKLLINVKPIEWPGNRARVLISLSVLNIFTWLLATTVTAMVLVKFNRVDSFLRNHSLDLLCPGVWGSLFYGLAGLLGICAAYEKRQPLLLGTLILALISLFSSMGISGVSGTMAIMTQFKAHGSPTWLGLEWTLLVLGAVGFVVNLAVFVVVSTLLCRPCCPQQRTDSPWVTNGNSSSGRYRSRNNYLRAEMVDALLPTPPPPGWIDQDSNQRSNRPNSARPVSDRNHQPPASPLPRVLVSDSSI